MHWYNSHWGIHFKNSPKKWWITPRLSKTFCSIVWSVFNAVRWCIYLTRNRQFCLNSWINGFWPHFVFFAGRAAHIAVCQIWSHFVPPRDGNDKNSTFRGHLCPSIASLYVPKYWRSCDQNQIYIFSNRFAMFESVEVAEEETTPPSMFVSGNSARELHSSHALNSSSS